MRLSPSILLCLLASQSAFAVTFQTRLDQVEWTVAGDQFECRLAQPIARFGSGEFVRRAGEQAIFRLHAHERWLNEGTATLLAAAAPWQPGRGDLNLGSIKVAGGNMPLLSSQDQGVRLIHGLLEGRSPVVRHHAARGGETLEIRLLPARFSKAYADYLACTAKLLPMNFDQVRQSRIDFPDGGVALSAAGQARLDVILQWLKADPSVNRISLDGHSDNSGNRLANRDLSRRRALVVMEYLQAKGVPEEQINLRFHGETYPLVANTSAANRARNRRVALRLERLPDAPEAPAVAPVTPAMPAPSTASTASPAF